MRKVLIVLLALMAAASCSKKDTVGMVDKPDTVKTPDTVVVPDSVHLMTKAFQYYNSGSSIDTTLEYYMRDTMYYNSDLRIEKIITTFNASDSVTSRYTYNSNGNITNLNVSAPFNNLYSNYNYRFYYNGNNRLDSMMKTGEIDTIRYKFSYDENNRLTRIQSNYYNPVNYFSSYEDGDIYHEENYYWSGTNNIDSIHTGYYTARNRDQIYDLTTLAIPAGTATIAADAIPAAYLLRLALQRDVYLPGGYINCYWQQFLNPGVPMLTSGIYNYASYYDGISRTGHAYNFSAVMNADNTVRWISNEQLSFTGTRTKYMGMNKLVYSKVPKK